MKSLFIALLPIVFIACKHEKKVKIHLTVNDKKLEISEKNNPIICKISYDSFTNATNIKSDYDFLQDKSVSFSYISLGDESKKIDDITIYFFFKITGGATLQKSIEVIYEDFSSKNNTAGLESVIKIKNSISTRFKFLKEGGTKDKFQLNITIDKEYASGTFSGNLTSDFDGSRVIITDGKFENIPFERRAIDNIK